MVFGVNFCNFFFPPPPPPLFIILILTRLQMFYT
jgi:hypothetical protein